MNVIVRADFYPNGEIVPLCITLENGSSIHIEKVINVKKDFNKHGAYKLLFICKTDAGLISLLFERNAWNCSLNS